MLILLNIQQKIEEKRLILGTIFEKFLLKNLVLFGRFLSQNFSKIIAKKYFATASCLAIILLSVFLQSSRDIGHDSAAYIEMAQKILAGEKYYHNFFENNLPFALYLTAIPIFFSNLFKTSPIIALQLFVNLIGIISIYSCAKILHSQKASKNISNSLQKFIIISFCFAYFIRIYTLQFNEYGTKSSYFLALALPYFCCLLSANNSRIFVGILAGLIICLKPNYAILIAAFEIYKSPLVDYNKILRNLVTVSVVALYAVLIKIFTPEYFAYLPQFRSLYFKISNINYFPTFKEDLFPLLIFITINFQIIKNNRSLKILLLATTACAAIIASEFIGGFDQRFIFFTFALPLTFLTSFYFYQNIFRSIISLKERISIATLILLCFILPQFDAKNIFPFLLNLCCFWWIVLFFFKKPNWPLIALALASAAISIFDYSGKISWLFCAIIFLCLINNYKKNLLKPLVILVSLILSYFASLVFAAVFNHQHLYASFLKSPNYINEEKIYFIEKYAPQKNDKIAVISNIIPDIYPIFTYLDKHNANPAHNLYSLYPKVSNLKDAGQKIATDYLFLKLREQISDKNNKLIFVKNHLNSTSTCTVSFIEYYLRDEDFKNIFLQNYQFLNRIIYFEKQDDRSFIAQDIEIYIRK